MKCVSNKQHYLGELYINRSHERSIHKLRLPPLPSYLNYHLKSEYGATEWYPVPQYSLCCHPIDDYVQCNHHLQMLIHYSDVTNEMSYHNFHANSGYVMGVQISF